MIKFILKFFDTFRKHSSIEIHILNGVILFRKRNIKLCTAFSSSEVLNKQLTVITTSDQRNKRNALKPNMNERKALICLQNILRLKNFDPAEISIQKYIF